MKSRREKHPKYKAYYTYQLRITQERYPFLSLQQIKAKILTAWEGFSLVKKDKWSPCMNHNRYVFAGDSRRDIDEKIIQRANREAIIHSNRGERSQMLKSSKKVHFQKSITEMLIETNSDSSTLNKSPDESLNVNPADEYALIFGDFSPKQPLCSLFEDSDAENFPTVRNLGTLNELERKRRHDVFTGCEDDIFM